MMTIIRRTSTFFRMAACVGMVSMLTACSSDDTPAQTESEVQRSAEEIYDEARAKLAEKQYASAAQLFDEVEREYPYSDWAPRAQIMAAYSHYKLSSYDDALVTLERFIATYPSHERVDYAYYLTALSYYEQISDVGRDQGMTGKAKKALRDVVRRFPGSRYARAAQLKMDLTNDHLAGKEMMVGRYYLKKKEYVAAVGRFRSVIEQYDTTSHAPEALHRLVEVYLLLGVRDQAERYGAVLGHNYPNSPWYQRSYGLLKPQEKHIARVAEPVIFDVSAPVENPVRMSEDGASSGWFDWW